MTRVLLAILMLLVATGADARSPRNKPGVVTGDYPGLDKSHTSQVPDNRLVTSVQPREPQPVKPIVIVPVPDKLVPTFADVWRYRISGGE